MTAFATVELAVEAMKLGAFDFVPKPFVPEAVRAVVRRACERTELLRENERLRGPGAPARPARGLLGGSRAMRALHELIGRVAPTNATVLIHGETGTGKELVARAIHDASPRASRPFVAVNCAGFAETLLESELFGHERGAFTGADRARQGVFEAAHGGTLFLDEAGEMPLPLQAKLLRVLMNGEVLRVGATAPRLVDVRVVVATNRDLQAIVRDRLVPGGPLLPARRGPDRGAAAAEPARGHSGPGRPLPSRRRPGAERPGPVPLPGARARLVEYGFPGNVRELRNLIERASILARGPAIEAVDLPLGGGGRSASGDGPGAFVETLPETVDLAATMTLVERHLVLRALALPGGVQAEAARRLGISRSLLSYKLKALGLSAEGASPDPNVKDLDTTASVRSGALTSGDPHRRADASSLMRKGFPQVGRWHRAC